MSKSKLLYVQLIIVLHFSIEMSKKKFNQSSSVDIY